MPLYEVKYRYVVEEVFQIKAPSKADAIEEMWSLDDGTWERIRNFVPQAKIIKS